MLKNYVWEKPFVLREIEKHDLNAKSGIYVIGTGRPINRMLATDPNGILYIGKSVNLQNRVWAFQDWGHDASEFLCEINWVCEKILEANYPECQREVEKNCRVKDCLVHIVSVERTLLSEAEHAALFAYLQNFGEYPPLNLSAPNRWHKPVDEDIHWAERGLKFKDEGHKKIGG